MADRLQEFDYRSSPYHRPNQPWMCGRLREGLPCDRGPSAAGQCQIDFECAPTSNGDRWTCARSMFAGGSCEHGPMPDGTCCRPLTRCTPTRSWRSRITFWSRWAAVFTVGLLLLLLGGGDVARHASPGQLTFQHADIGCAGCHTAVADAPTTWLQTALGSGVEHADAKQCLDCHAFGANAFNPHNRSTEQLAAVTSQAAPSTEGGPAWRVQVASTVFAGAEPGAAATRCASCHNEHRGAAVDLTQTSEARCQACHDAKFASLSSGHPNFAKYPFSRRTSLIFDHPRHFSTHFREAAVAASAPRGCNGCHEVDQDGGAMLLKPFEQTCSACHAGQITGAGRASAKGLEIFSAPGLDAESLVEANVPIGSWPEDAEGEITPFMAVLLSVSPDLAESVDALHGEDLLDLADSEPSHHAHAGATAWGIKHLLFDIATGGSAALRERLAAVQDREATEHHTRLTGQLPRETIVAAQREWFPRLHHEVPAQRAGRPIPSARVGAPEAQSSPSPAPQQKPDGEGDSILGDDAKGGDNILGGGDKKADGGDSILGGDDKKADAGDSILGGDDKKPDGGDSILGGNDSILGGADKKADAGDSILGGDDKKPDGGDSILGGNDSILGGDPDKPAAAPSPVVETAELPPSLDGETWAEAGGWYRDDFSIRYRPLGHADPFMVAWFDLAAALKGSKSSGAANRLLDVLAEPKAPGRCGKCHSVDTVGDGPAVIHWRAKRPAADDHQFTQFSHRAHFSLLDEEGCLSCHSMDGAVDSASGYKDGDPKTFAANFKPISRETCARCHTPSNAGDSCLSCHNYHVGNFPSVFVSAPKLMPKEVSARTPAK